MRISDWSSDVCSSDLCPTRVNIWQVPRTSPVATFSRMSTNRSSPSVSSSRAKLVRLRSSFASSACLSGGRLVRSEEHTSELQSLMRISYAVFCLKKNKNTTTNIHIVHTIDTTVIHTL